jgi:hypothetical protein
MNYKIKEIKLLDMSALDVIVEEHSRMLHIDGVWYHLHLPKMKFIITYKSTYFFEDDFCFTDEDESNAVSAFVSITDDLFVECPLPNIYKTDKINFNTGLVCFGGVFILANSLEELVERILTEFYSSSFKNSESAVTSSNYDGFDKEYYKEWEKTKKCPYHYPVKNYSEFIKICSIQAK